MQCLWGLLSFLKQNQGIQYTSWESQVIQRHRYGDLNYKIHRHHIYHHTMSNTKEANKIH
ncbi:hypothetical protein BGX38DRAFT_1195889 [Terfezia claveryi]|nr:hypothetical protein BGX38DRAFT_1240929 [Terfezia claveryi]KAF8445268.1 hypothetical protein BGX38DRAFT_1195889 [Terfezia claveryi]